jgi:hypothetical protein
MSKERDPNTYNTIAGLDLHSAIKCAYWVLWNNPDGLTRGEIARDCKAQGWEEDETLTWSKTVSEMSKLGLVERGIKRHCAEANKEDQVWEITNATTVKRIKAPKPSTKKYERAVDQLEILMIHHDGKGDGMVTPELRDLFSWLKDKISDD